MWKRSGQKEMTYPRKEKGSEKKNTRRVEKRSKREQGEEKES